jgi:hypothetical protein
VAGAESPGGIDRRTGADIVVLIINKIEDSP